MAKAKKVRTPEEQAAINARMAKLRAARQAKNKNPQTETTSQITQAPLPPEVTDPGPIGQNYDDLQRQVQELKAMMFDRFMPSDKTGPQVTQQGMIGTMDRYPVDPAYYPDPRPRLFEERRLTPIAFKENYELQWEVGSVSYNSIDGIRLREPRFTLRLVQIQRDEYTGEATNKRIIRCQVIFHEDKDAALIIASENGLAVDEENVREFLDEMRYLRMRDWLLEAFFPPKPQDGQHLKEMVVNGQLLPYFEVNAEGSSSIPFDKLNDKLKT